MDLFRCILFRTLYFLELDICFLFLKLYFNNLNPDMSDSKAIIMWIPRYQSCVLFLFIFNEKSKFDLFLITLCSVFLLKYN